MCHDSLGIPGCFCLKEASGLGQRAKAEGKARGGRPFGLRASGERVAGGGRVLPEQLNKSIHAREREREQVSVSQTASGKGHTGDACASGAEEGRGTLRKAPSSRVQALEAAMSEWGNPVPRQRDHLRKERGTAPTETSQ